MKNNLRVVLAVALFAFVAGSASVAFGQIRVGGYRAAKTDDAGVEAAAAFAVEFKGRQLEEQLSLEGVVKAETQLVQGTNYRLCLNIYVPSKEEETDGVQMTVQVIVYRDLKKVYKLTSWKETECSE